MSYPAPTRLSSPSTDELLEREDATERIRELTLAAAAGEGATAAIIGRPGEGKTALLSQACAIASAAGLRVLRARGSDLERAFALGAARQLLEPAVRTLATDELDRVLAGAAGLAGGVLDIDVGGGDGDAAPGPAQSFAALHGLYWLTVGLAETQPLLLVLDDAHWADAATLQWLSFLSRRLDELPVLVMFAARAGSTEVAHDGVPEDEQAGEPNGGAPKDELAALLGDPRVAHLTLGALSEHAVGVLIERALGTAPDPAFTQRLRLLTAGNPLAVHELLREHARHGGTPTAEAAANLGERAPDALQRDALARLARLAAPASAVAQALAVLGDGAEPRRIAALAEVSLRDAGGALDVLTAEDLLAQGPAPIFCHPLLRTAVYDALAARARAGMHARAATLLRADGADPEAVAAHLLLCDPAGEEDSVLSLRAAAAAAIRRGAPAMAVAHLSRAWDEPPPPAERAAVLAELAQAEVLIRSPLAIEHLHCALEQSEDPVTRARLRWLLSDVQFFVGDWDPALAQLRQAVNELGGTEPDLTLRLEGRLLTLGALDARAAAATGGVSEERIESLRARAGVELPGARMLRLNVALLLAVRAHTPARVRPLILTGIDEGRFLESESADAVEAVHAAFGLVLIDDLGGALEFTGAMLADAAARGSVLGFLAGSTFRTLAHLRGGALVEAEADAFDALALAYEQELHFTIPFIAAYLSLTLLERGRAQEAWELLAPVPLPPAVAGTPAGLTLLEARGRVHRGRGDLARARADLSACGEVCKAIGVRNPNVVSWRSELALTLRGEEPKQARELAAEELELAREAGTPRGIGVALRACAALAPAAERETLLDEAVAALEDSPARLELARALIDLGAHQRRAGYRAQARQPLLRGLELAHACRAVPLAELAHEELLAAGARPRRPWLTGVDALTPSELRVARLAAAGQSNRSIAQGLFITTPTVKGHLSRAYRKLGITAREQLADALEGKSSQTA